MEKKIKIGTKRCTVVDSNPRGTSQVRQCFNCQEFGHIKSDCKNEMKCKRCGEAHGYKDCKVPDHERICSNCHGPHPSTYTGCPKYVKEVGKQNKEKAANVQKNTIPNKSIRSESGRLALAIATAIGNILVKRLKLNVARRDVCKDVAEAVASAFHTIVHADEVYHIAFGRH
jgi:hypothetical protein